MATLERPKLRPLSARRVDHEGQALVALEDPLGVASGPVMIPMDGFHWVVRHFDGTRELKEIQADVLRQTGHLIPSADMETLVAQLDRAMILDGPTFQAFHQEYRGTYTRPAALAGRSYAATEKALKAQLGHYFAHENGAGLSDDNASHADPAKSLRGILSPHIDFGRGGPVYTWPYKDLARRCDAEIFVILGVAHQYCANRFALTRKDFETPLGLARTDRAYVDKISALAGDHFFDDELAHRTEHSIEFQVVFLQYLLGESRDYSIVPILVGSFHDLMGREPIDDPEVHRFIEAMKAAEHASNKKVAYIGGIDLAHVGQEFGDPDLLNASTLDQIREFDTAMLDRATASDPSGWFETASKVQNRWRVCGLAATYTMLHAMGPTSGKLLRYDQAVNPERTCCVSFAGVSYDSPPKSDE